MEKIKCTIERITFQNPENGYSVLQATIKGYRDEQTLVGTFHEVTVGAVLTVEGTWRVDKRYGRQFAVEKWTEELPATVIGIEKYLGSGLVKGIGPKFAKQIVSHFGLETFEVIENNIDVETMAHSFAIDEHLEFQQDEAGTKAMFARERRSRERYNCCVAEDATMPVGSFFNEES